MQVNKSNEGIPIGGGRNQLTSSSSSPSSSSTTLPSSTMNNSTNNNLLSLIPSSQIKLYDSEVTSMFEKNAPEQMKTIESNTRFEIEDKKMQLRRLIGYRDLVEGSDSIVKMKQSCESITEMIGTMQTSLKMFSEKRLQKSNNTKIDSQSQKKDIVKRKIGSIARHCRFLIDISEKIWRSIDRNEYFESSVQYLKAIYLYNRIKSGGQSSEEIKKLLDNLPVIEEQWMTIQQFPSKTVTCAREFLMRSTLSTEHYVGSLSSLVMFDKKSVTDVFVEFLHVRSLAFSHIISKSLSSQKKQTTTDSATVVLTVKSTLVKMVDYIKSTLYLILIIFVDDTYQYDDNPPPPIPALSFTSSVLEVNFEWKTPYIKQCIAFLEEVQNGGGKISGQWWDADQDDGLSSSGNTATAATTFSSTSNRDNVSTRIIREKTLEWLNEVLQKIISTQKEVLAPIKSAKDLSLLRVDILAELSVLSQHQQEKNNSNEKVVDLIGIQVPIEGWNWVTVANNVIGKDLTRIIDVLEEVFLTKSEGIIANTFSSINLTSLLQHKMLLLRPEDKNFGTSFLWTQRQDDDTVQSIRNKTNGITPLSDHFLQQVNQMYTNCVSDFVYLFPSSEQTKLNGGGLMASPAPTPRSATLSTMSSRLSILQKRNQFSQTQSIIEKYQIKENELREYMRQSFHNSIKQFCNDNQSTIVSLYKEIKLEQQQQKIHEILFIAKASKLFYKHIIQNPNLFFLPIDQSNSNSKNETPLSLKIIEELKSIYYLGFIIWVENFIQIHSTSLLSTLLSLSWDNSNHQKTKSWQSFEIQADNQQTQIHMPYLPSSFILSFLFDITKQINQISFNTLDRNIQKYISQCIANHIYKIVSQFLSTIKTTSNNGPISKEGYIQLLLDMKYLSYVLYGNKKAPIIKDQSFKRSKDYFDTIIVENVDNPQQSISKTFNDIIQLIEEKVMNIKIDPIDLSLYKDHISKFVETSYSKTWTMLGIFTQIHRTVAKPIEHKSPTMSSSSSKQSYENTTNIIPLIKSNVRFQLFTIETPIEQTLQPTPTTTTTNPTTQPSSMNQKSNTNIVSPPLHQQTTASLQSAASKTFSLMDSMTKRFTQFGSGTSSGHNNNTQNR
ncbi:oligomeric Golgi complex component [Cavenderia fasciculata]|uniref:Conserved oligomeric Golgi complex subunit 1 n=1 Tax=Cavenderia fasciculata TaxID=261658 RepID=F4Q6R5_CACFS|nr:oligomeric Golgi complex component [Cavenderia fasciculata]EGG16575.1 oligomeric Golgi complex component [Cavenderia fasciculata]|eukprot:XP_004354975.1 oligomeric Golgi complex component [Cavenderia fasciculata]